ncbi:MAG: putative sugar O-methyltransferase [Myxococcota bacterium]|nr:putative sugar O-methyltransferase [Myxococcota bacterium]
MSNDVGASSRSARALDFDRPSFRSTPLPPEASALCRDHPRLQELRARYRSFGQAVTSHVSWTDRYLLDELDLRYFRGDNAYVWQLRGLRDHELAARSYALTAYYVRSIDTLGLFERLEEDGLFGVHTFEVGRRLVSRDLLDSVNEILFLERHLGLSRLPEVRFVDIGAGYGRLAHRVTVGLPNVARFLCADAVPESTFLCEFYLRFRGVSDRARAVPLDEIEAVLLAEGADIATNIHSFSECSADVIRWWIDLLHRARVPHLLIVPNDGERLLSREADGTARDFMPLLEQAGYRLRVSEPKYLDPTVQKHGVHGGYYHLFDRASEASSPST